MTTSVVGKVVRMVLYMRRRKEMCLVVIEDLTELAIRRNEL